MININQLRINKQFTRCSSVQQRGGTSGLCDLMSWSQLTWEGREDTSLCLIMLKGKLCCRLPDSFLKRWEKKEREREGKRAESNRETAVESFLPVNVGSRALFFDWFMMVTFWSTNKQPSNTQQMIYCGHTLNFCFPPLHFSLYSLIHYIQLVQQ